MRTAAALVTGLLSLAAARIDTGPPGVSVKRSRGTRAQTLCPPRRSSVDLDVIPLGQILGSKATHALDRRRQLSRQHYPAHAFERYLDSARRFMPSTRPASDLVLVRQIRVFQAPAAVASYGKDN
jgi:hypothetical protein